MREAQSIPRTTFITSYELLLLSPESSVGARMERNFVDCRLLCRIAHHEDAIHQPAIETSTDQTSFSPCFKATEPACHAIDYWAEHLPLKRAESERDVRVLGDTPGFPGRCMRHEVQRSVYRL